MRVPVTVRRRGASDRAVGSVGVGRSAVWCWTLAVIAGSSEEEEPAVGSEAVRAREECGSRRGERFRPFRRAPLPGVYRSLPSAIVQVNTTLRLTLTVVTRKWPFEGVAVLPIAWIVNV
jgi:hypothetical protein